VLAYLVQLRTLEMGIRMAMGAERGRVLWRVLRQGLALAGLGIGVGVVLVLVLGQVVQAGLFGIPARDPLTLVGAALGLGAAVLVASHLPARRAASLDPVVVLRGE
jgi:ABC-type antimicrobial peptide transport system permease subunit